MSTPAKPVHVPGTIARKEMISPTVAHLTITTEEPLPPFKPGQFCWLTIEKDGEKLRRPYSIASAPWERDLALCIKRIPGGKASGPIVDCEEGTAVDVFAPMGLFTLPEQHDQEHHLLVGVGTGVAPYRSMIRELFRKHYSGKGEDTTKDITLLFGTRNKEEIIYEQEFKELEEKHKNFHYHVTLSREDLEGMLKGYVQHHLQDVLKEPQRTNVFICGLKQMVIEVNKACREAGVPKHHIHEELY